MKREILRSGADFVLDTQCDTGPGCFDPKWPSGLNFNSKGFSRRTDGPVEYRDHPGAVVKPNGREAYYCPQPPDDGYPFIGVMVPSRNRK